MILVVTRHNRHRFDALLNDMVHLRNDSAAGPGRTAFAGMDAFDQADPTYLLCLDSDYRLAGCARLLETTGPHVLPLLTRGDPDALPDLFGPDTREVSALCVDHRRLSPGHGQDTVFQTLCELMAGLLIHARRHGAKRILTVLDPAMDRALRRAGNIPDQDLPLPAGDLTPPMVAAWTDCNSDRVAEILDRAAITGPLFATDAEVQNAIRPLTHGALDPDLQDYCLQQITNARSGRERAAALALRRALTGMSRSHRKCDA